MAARYDTCPDCRNLKTVVSARCLECHLVRKRLPTKHCLDCGKPIVSQAKRCRPCSAIARRGRRLMASGHVRLFRPEHSLAQVDGYVLEHRLVVFEAGFDVPDGYHVHHRNGVKDDNRIENLEVLAAADHARLHIAEAGNVVTNQYGTFPVWRSGGCGG